MLTQLGTHAQQRFAEHIGKLKLTPPQVGLLRAIATEPGRSQQQLASFLGTPPTRLVAMVDELERRDLVLRKRNPDDRRLYALHLTAAGKRMMGRIAEVGTAHEDAILDGLSAAERQRLHELLARIAVTQGLAADVHPGYRDLATVTPSRDASRDAARATSASGDTRRR
ncbi:MAG: MarR family transcriptional regulator [Sciscionella sp.]|nr:MarR family transcriptional regulator [Sciscionella sp.]